MAEITQSNRKALFYYVRRLRNTKNCEGKKHLRSIFILMNNMLTMSPENNYLQIKTGFELTFKFALFPVEKL